jgi:hypothetical protein
MSGNKHSQQPRIHNGPEFGKNAVPTPIFPDESLGWLLIRNGPKMKTGANQSVRICSANESNDNSIVCNYGERVAYESKPPPSSLAELIRCMTAKCSAKAFDEQHQRRERIHGKTHGHR